MERDWIGQSPLQKLKLQSPHDTLKLIELLFQNSNILSEQKELKSVAMKVSMKVFLWLTLTRPLRRKLRMRCFFDVSKVKESSFFKADLSDFPQIFDAHLLENTNLSPSSFHFSVDFISRSYFESDGFIAYSNK